VKQFISNLKLSRKFTLIGVLVLAMVAMPVWLVIKTAVTTLSVARAEAAGIAPSGDMLTLIKLTQQHRGQSAMVLAGNDGVRAARQANRTEVEQAMSRVRQSVAGLADPRLDERLAAIQREWQVVADAIDGKSIAGPQSFARHTVLIAGQLALLDDIVDSSTLAFDSEAGTYYMILSVLGHLPRLTESLGQMRAVGAALLTRGEAMPEDRMAVSVIGTMAQQHLRNARAAFDKAMDAEPALRRTLDQPVASAVSAAEAVLKLTDAQIVRAEVLGLPGADYFATMTRAIDPQFDLVDVAFKALDATLSERVAAEQRALWLVLGGSVPGAIALWIIVLTARTTTRSIGQAVQLAQNVVAGDLTSKIEVTSTDEAGHLLAALKDMTGNLATTIGELQLAAAVFDSSLDAIVITDSQGTILKANAAATRVTGYSADELLGRNPRIFQSGRHDRAFYAELWRSVMQDGRWQGEIYNRRKNGEVFPELLSISVIRDERGAIGNYISIFIDISAQKEAERRLDYMAHYDGLTGLPNRDLFNDRLLVALAQAKRSSRPIAVLFIDLDHFKYVNDTFGHVTGDELLRAVAHRIQGSLREEDTLSRISGDEFTVLLQHFDTREGVGLVADKILSAMKLPFGIGEHELYISASIGISIYPEDGDHPGLLLNNSDTAMYHAKSDGRGGVRFFMSGMEGHSIKRLELERHLHHALEQEEFLLSYQPQFDLGSGRLTGVEALLRWQRPEVGLVSPQDFIPLAEETGLIVPIGEWVLRTACAQGCAWGRTGAGLLRVAVNISARQFGRVDFCEMVGTILYDTGFPPDCLELELTESLAMHHAEETVLTLKKLKALGVQISIDDFGTGYSSLSYLKRFPVDSLKIDKSFVDGIADDPNDAAIVIAIIAMAHSMGLGVIAEGVETEEQLDFLKLHLCNEVQGFLLGRPMPPEQIGKLLAIPD
jgi:diguanylate cyclase (GGDEF)-like protein/PAS domain S-box-containing protein